MAEEEGWQVYAEDRFIGLASLVPPNMQVTRHQYNYIRETGMLQLVQVSGDESVVLGEVELGEELRDDQILRAIQTYKA